MSKVDSIELGAIIPVDVERIKGESGRANGIENTDANVHPVLLVAEGREEVEFGH